MKGSPSKDLQAFDTDRKDREMKHNFRSFDGRDAPVALSLKKRADSYKELQKSDKNTNDLQDFKQTIEEMRKNLYYRRNSSRGSRTDLDVKNSITTSSKWTNNGAKDTKPLPMEKPQPVSIDKIQPTQSSRVHTE